MSRTIHIRRAEPADADRIAELHRASIQELCGQSYSAEQITGWIEPLVPERYLPAMDEFDFLVAETDRVIGFCILNTEISELLAIYFDPGSAGHGYGRELLRFAESLARVRGVTELKLKSTLNAVGFYAACGYTRVRDSVHTGSTGLELPCVEMVRNLSDIHPENGQL